MYIAALPQLRPITAEVPEPGNKASIFGALTTAASILEISSFFTLPRNTYESASIPITSSVIPLAAITILTCPELDLAMRAAVGWRLSPGRSASVLFKIWCGAPNTGKLIYSSLDTGEGNFDLRKVTALAHVDRGFFTFELMTYTLTTELKNPGAEASVIGSIILMVVPEN